MGLSLTLFPPPASLLGSQFSAFGINVDAHTRLMMQRASGFKVVGIAGVDVFHPKKALSCIERAGDRLKALGLIFRPVIFTDRAVTRQLKVRGVIRVVSGAFSGWLCHFAMPYSL